MIYVRTKLGRVAFMSPSGPRIPNDAFVPVAETAYINRLLNVHGDIERKPEEKKAPETPPSSVTKAPEPTKRTTGE